MARPTDPLRKEARQSGAKFYCGPPCKLGHGADVGHVERYTTTGACRCCVQVQQRPDRVSKRPRDRRTPTADPLAAVLG